MAETKKQPSLENHKIKGFRARYQRNTASKKREELLSSASVSLWRFSGRLYTIDCVLLRGLSAVCSCEKSCKALRFVRYEAYMQRVWSKVLTIRKLTSDRRSSFRRRSPVFYISNSQPAYAAKIWSWPRFLFRSCWSLPAVPSHPGGCIPVPSVSSHRSGLRSFWSWSHSLRLPSASRHRCDAC